MRIGKKLLGFACMLLIPSLMVSASDDYGVKAGMENVTAADGVVSVYISQNQGESYDLTNSDIKVLLNDQELEVTDKVYAKEQAEPVSYYCMVDVSGSMDENRMNTVKDILGQMVDSKGEQDNFCISTIGDNLNNMGLSGDSAAVHEMIDSIAVTHEDTNLYYGITEMIKAMQKDEGVHTLRYFIIFSDGAEDQATGITREEATAEIENSHIPVYTVAMLKASSSNNELESAKVLGSFARKSIGGMHFTPTLDEYKYAEIPARIKGVSDTGIIVKANLGQPELNGNEASVKVTGLTDVDTKLEMSVETAMLQQAIVIPEPETVPEEPTTEAAPVEEQTNNMIYVYIAIAALVILIIIIILIIVNHKKSKNQQYAENMYAEPEEMPEGDGWEMGNISAPSSTPTPAAVSTPTPAKKTRTLHFIRMGIQESAEYEIKLADEYVIGRKAGKCDLVITDDVALSSEHCKLKEVDGDIYLEDLNSSNGTFVNGVPITGAFALNADDIIIIGSYEYRISW